MSAITCFDEPKKSGDDCHETVDAQLEHLRTAGFESVEILWSEDLWCVFGGRKPDQVSDAGVTPKQSQPSDSEG
jgi:hypothetical protein